jgi:hypothetical protein
MELESWLTHPFRAWWKIKSFTRLLGCLQRDSNSSLPSLFNQVFLVYLAERSFTIVGIQQTQFHTNAEFVRLLEDGRI